MLKIFASFISRDVRDDAKRIAYMYWFVHTFPEMEFARDDRLMYNFCQYAVKLDIPLREKYMEIFIKTELKSILIKENIRVDGTDELSFLEPTSLETAYRITGNVLMGGFRELLSINDDIDDFKVSAEAFMRTQLSQRAAEMLSKSYEILSQTESPKEALDYSVNQGNLLQEIYDTDQLEELVECNTHDDTLNFVCDTGIPAIDNDSTGIYETYLIGIEAQPGTGKTRYALGVYVYRAATIYKKNVIFYALEQDEREIRAILIARHVFELFRIQIVSDLILKGKVPEEYRQQVEAAKLDLFESGKYGKIYIYSGSLYLMSLTQQFKNDDKLHGPFDLIAVDYMGMIEQQKENTSKYVARLEDYQVIGRSFKKFKRYLRATRKCGIAISQFNDKGIEAGKADKEITTNMAQGGIEVYRNTDANYAFSMTPQMKLQQKRRVSQPKVRGTAGFESFILDSRLGIAYFFQNVQGKV